MLMMAALTLWAAYRTTWPWVKLGYGVCGVANLVGIVVIWASSLRDIGQPEPAVQTRLYGEYLLQYYDRQIRLLRTVNWWLLVPLNAGVALVAYGVWARTGRLILPLLVGVALPVLALRLGSYLNEVYGVDRIRKKRQELVDLLTEAGWEP